ncbi:hypothetical protein WMY93_029732 [Mugilogobius chulae]|uniref:Death-associated protein 1 n=1 Tax=Mugilogobius chulae TaxID=88201 RepID=A0AAW0MXU0_9GOBI
MNGGYLSCWQVHPACVSFSAEFRAVRVLCFDNFSPPKPQVIVSGVVTKGDKDFTPAAAQVAHQKPLPGVPKLPPAQHINQHIHQPRK